VIQCKGHYYDIYEQMQTAENFNKIYESMLTTKENMVEADQDRLKLIRQLEQQIEIS